MAGKTTQAPRRRGGEQAFEIGDHVAADQACAQRETGGRRHQLGWRAVAIGKMAVDAIGVRHARLRRLAKLRLRLARGEQRDRGEKEALHRARASGMAGAQVARAADAW